MMKKKHGKKNLKKQKRLSEVDELLCCVKDLETKLSKSTLMNSKLNNKIDVQSERRNCSVGQKDYTINELKMKLFNVRKGNKQVGKIKQIASSNQDMEEDGGELQQKTFEYVQTSMDTKGDIDESEYIFL